jgi:hypothetical protein
MLPRQVRFSLNSFGKASVDDPKHPIPLPVVRENGLLRFQLHVQVPVPSAWPWSHGYPELNRLGSWLSAVDYG